MVSLGRPQTRRLEECGQEIKLQPGLEHGLGLDPGDQRG